MNAELLANLGTTIAAIDTGDFPAALAAAMQQVVPFTYMVVFAYRGAEPPRDLFDNFPDAKRRIYVSDYQEGPYLLDPFYLAASKPVAPGLYRLRDLAPDRFYQGEYFRSYYEKTGLAEEIGYFIPMPGDAVIVVSLMRADRVFSSREFQTLDRFRPVTQSCVQQHWGPHMSMARPDPESIAKGRIERSFETFGQGQLTPREREIAEYTLRGHSAEAVGTLLSISSGTVRIHRRNIYTKLRISSQGELFSAFIEALRKTL